MTVGERIKQRRLELGLTQEELAKRMGYNGRTSVCVAEQRGDNVTTTRVAKFAKALGVSQMWLMFGDEADEEAGLYDPDAETELIERAKKYYALYSKASPEVQNAVELLLKSSQQNQD